MPLAAVKIANRWGYVDKEGNVVIAPQFDDAMAFYDGLALVKIGGHIEFIDLNGKAVIIETSADKFDFVTPFSEGLAAARRSGHFGYIDHNSKFVIPPQFQEAWYFTSGLAAVKVGGKWGYDRVRSCPSQDWPPMGLQSTRAGSSFGVRRAGSGTKISQTGMRSGVPRMVASRMRVLVTAVTLMVTLVALPQRSPAQDSAGRPILYDDFDEATGKFVTSAVYPDGRLLKNLVQARGAVWSPDGTWFAFVKNSADGGAALIVRNSSGDEKTILTVDRGNGVYSPMWAPDGRRLAVLTFQPQPNHPRLNVLVVIDTTTTKTILRQEISEQTIHLPYYFSPPGKFGWSPDGRKILIAWENVIVVDAENGRVETIAPAPAIAEWAPDSSGVYYFAMKNYRDPRTRALGALYLKKLGVQGPTTILEEGRVRAAGLDFLHLILGRMALSPSGNELAVALGLANRKTMVLQVYDLKTGQTSRFERPSKSFELQRLVLALDWAPDESGLAALTVGDDGLRVERLDLAGGEWKVLATVIEASKMGSVDADALGFIGLSWTR